MLLKLYCVDRCIEEKRNDQGETVEIEMLFKFLEDFQDLNHNRMGCLLCYMKVVMMGKDS